MTMADPATLAALRARIASAQGADRELDCLLHVTLFGWRLARIGPDYDGENACEIYTSDGRPYDDFAYPPRGKISRFYHVPDVRYTASIDDAIVLVERVLPGWRRYLEEVEANKRWWSGLKAPSDKQTGIPGTLCAYAPTAALATLLALCDALIARAQEDTDA